MVDYLNCNTMEVNNMFTDKKILITGGTGSFGNAVLKRFLNTNIKEIRVFSRDEKKQEEMRLQLNNDKLKFHIGDVRDFDSVERAVAGADYIFHAAALKQVPSCEFYPMEAVKTNIIGADNVLNAAVKNNVERVIILSTDKAVYPINAMGISKAMMEKIMVSRSRMIDKESTILCGTRYGNVMASRGSVIPLFIKQIKEGKNVTITDSRMTRFMMSLDEAVDLVIYAYKNAKQGDIFVKKAPASTIGDIAVALIEIFNSKSDVISIGSRHGEKMNETLVTREEMARAEDIESYYRIFVDDRDLNYNKYFSQGETKMSDMEDYNSNNTRRLSLSETKKTLLALDYVQKELNS